MKYFYALLSMLIIMLPASSSFSIFPNCCTREGENIELETHRFLFISSYESLREEFKFELFACQQNLIAKEDAYYAFIEPYIQEAENTLKIIQYCKKNFKFALRDTYFSCLLDYNAAYFNQYAVPSKFGKRKLEQRARNLLQTIENIKKEEGLNDLNVQEEYQKIVELFHKVTLAYYNELSFPRKMTIHVYAFLAKVF